MPKGSDFSKKTIQLLANRAAQLCSRPSCRKTTSGPHSEESKSLNLGQAAHIKGARPTSARYDLDMTDEQRRHISNGIWLCILCAREIDIDEKKFLVEALRSWKEEHDLFVQLQGPQIYSYVHDREELCRLQKEIEELRHQLNSKEDFENKYNLIQTPSGAWVYVSTEDPRRYVCQCCHANGSDHILHPRGTLDIPYCLNCKSPYPIGPRRNTQQKFAIGSRKLLSGTRTYRSLKFGGKSQMALSSGHERDTYHHHGARR